ncbi:hypothetical protein ACLB2K_031305 [Fragaria x ananassa]
MGGSGYKFEDSDKKSSHTGSHMIGFRATITWVFLIMSMLYVLYSSNHLLNSQDCATLVNIKNHLQTVTNVTGSNDVSKLGVQGKQGLGQEAKEVVPSRPQQFSRFDTELKHIVFGIAASSNLWEKRKEYIKLWWKKEMRGVVWLDKKVRMRGNEVLPEIRISGDTRGFKYTNRQGQRSALRISRVVSETLRLGMKDVRWFVMGDDDTVFVVENVLRILSKYDHNQFYYIGHPSESHIQNIFFSYTMAFGGGGFAISYPLAVELEKMQDRCIQRYPALYGSDDRMQACMAELGVPLTKEAGFHQYDVYGNLVGLLSAHPVAPLVTLHHLDVVEPVFPRMSRVKALQHLFQSVEFDSASIMQQSICYDKDHLWSISISWGYVVQVIRGVMSPRELETPSRTFLNWYRKGDFTSYSFNTRPVYRDPCQKPFLFYLTTNRLHRDKNKVFGFYKLERSRSPHCRWKMASPDTIDTIIVLKRPDPVRWEKSPRRDCCRILPSKKNSTMFLWVDNCREGEMSEL